jgi:hypothetical protein
MSFPLRGGVTVEVTISANEALELVRNILGEMSRVKDWQESNPTSDLSTSRNDGDTSAQSLRLNFSLGESVNLVILPDLRSPNSSAYGIYSTPVSPYYINVKEKGVPPITE